MFSFLLRLIPWYCMRLVSVFILVCTDSLYRHGWRGILFVSTCPLQCENRQKINLQDKQLQLEKLGCKISCQILVDLLVAQKLIPVKIIFFFWLVGVKTRMMVYYLVMSCQARTLKENLVILMMNFYALFSSNFLSLTVNRNAGWIVSSNLTYCLWLNVVIQCFYLRFISLLVYMLFLFGTIYWTSSNMKFRLLMYFQLPDKTSFC